MAKYDAEIIDMSEYERSGEGANGESYNGIGLYPDLETEDVERIIEFPTGLAVFNHWNYQGIEDGAYHEPCYAYEQRLELLVRLTREAHHESRTQGYPRHLIAYLADECQYLLLRIVSVHP